MFIFEEKLEKIYGFRPERTKSFGVWEFPGNGIGHCEGVERDGSKRDAFC